MSEERLVPARAGRGQLRDRGSRFFSYAFEVETALAAQAELSRLRREHHDATHVAFAWKIGEGRSSLTRVSDAGEPAGTAGNPILAAIESAGVTDALVVVAREFGGTKLGTAGLVRAYRGAAAAALEDAGTRVRYATVRVTVISPPSRVGALRRILDPPAVTLEEEKWDAEAGQTHSRVAVRPSRLESFLAALAEARLSYELSGS